MGEPNCVNGQCEPSAPPPTDVMDVPEAPEEDRSNCIEGYCEIPARTFTMGDWAEREGIDHYTPRRVKTSTIWLHKTEVTIGEYRAYLEAKPQPVAVLPMGGKCGEMNGKGDDYPVVCVTQQEASAFCAYEEAALPSEVDIENASRGISGVAEFGTPSNKAISHYGRHYLEDGRESTAPVCGPNNERANSFGICDLAGNVSERTSTRYFPAFMTTGEYHELNEPFTGTFKHERIVIRGGSFLGRGYDARADARSDVRPDKRIFDLGFRCVRLHPPLKESL